MNNKGGSHKNLCVHDVIYIVKGPQRLGKILEMGIHFIEVVGYKLNIQNQSLVYQEQAC